MLKPLNFGFQDYLSSTLSIFKESFLFQMVAKIDIFLLASLSKDKSFSIGTKHFDHKHDGQQCWLNS